MIENDIESRPKVYTNDTLNILYLIHDYASRLFFKHADDDKYQMSPSSPHDSGRRRKIEIDPPMPIWC